jgi:hypothetical protein
MYTRTPLSERQPFPRFRISRQSRTELRALAMMAITVVSVLAVVAVAVPLAAYFSQYGRLTGGFGAGRQDALAESQQPFEWRHE